MDNVGRVIDLFYELIIKENEGLFSEKEQKLYNVYLDGLSLNDSVSVEARKDDLKARYTVIYEFLKSTPEPVVLDAGCGIGHQAFLLSLLGAHRVVAVDITEDRLQLAKKRKGFFEAALNRRLNIDFINDDIFRVIKLHKFDMIHCKDSVSHIHPLERFIELASVALRKKGAFVVDEPNQFNPIRLYYVLRQFYEVTGRFAFYTTAVINPATGETVLQAQERLVSPTKLKAILGKTRYTFCHFSRGGGWLIPKTTIAKWSNIHSSTVLKALEKLEQFISYVPFMNLFFGSFLLIAEKKVD